MDLREYAVLAINRGAHCFNCHLPVRSKDFRYRPHSDGWAIEGLTEKQWLFFECPECHYETSFEKLGITRPTPRIQPIAVVPTTATTIDDDGHILDTLLTDVMVNTMFSPPEPSPAPTDEPTQDFAGFGGGMSGGAGGGASWDDLRPDDDAPDKADSSSDDGDSGGD